MSQFSVSIPSKFFNKDIKLLYYKYDSQGSSVGFDEVEMKAQVNRVPDDVESLVYRSYGAIWRPVRNILIPGHFIATQPYPENVGSIAYNGYRWIIITSSPSERGIVSKFLCRRSSPYP